MRSGRSSSLHRRLLAWYADAARDLPWRRTRDPYAIWVSEVMLQQTQVAMALPYYRRFLRRFPTVIRLARARRETVLAEWSGLGYYRRARLLHDAARVVAREHAGRVPSDPEVFRRLPGVGRYTCGAVLSIAFGRRLPVVDGNVARVYSRLFALPLHLRDPRGARRLWALSESLVPMRRPGDWNQALMELGATLCLPRTPKCGECPLSRSCRAHREGRVEAFPPVARRRETVRVRRAIALVEHDGRWLLERRTGALLDGLWEPPGVELRDGEVAGRALTARLRDLGVRAKLTDTGERIRHTITHRRIEVEVWKATGTRRLSPGKGARVALIEATARGVAMTALGRKALKRIDVR